MTFEKYLQKSHIKISKNLKNFLKDKKEQKIPQIFKNQEIITKLEEFAIRGKMIRGSLFLFAVEMMGKSLDSEALNIATAIELMHTSLLVQDDIIDRDYQRRGIKTIFAQYQDKGEKNFSKTPYHYGISMGIVASDAALFLAFELLSSYKRQNLAHLIKFYSQEIYMVALAQGVDTHFGQTPEEATREEIYSIYKYKTARYTFSLPFEMAGIVANADKKDIDILGKIGELAGVIFQIKDDEIGLLGDEDTIGKPVGSDIKENKKTLIRALLFESVDKNELNFLKKCFGNEDITQKDVEKIKKIIYKNNILGLLENEIESLMEKVWVEFEKLKVEKKYKNILKELLEFNRERSF